MVERAIFDFYKRIPVVGFAYGAVRGAVYGLRGDEAEFKHSWEMDLADLNPLHMPRNIVNAFRNIDSVDEGIWIGRRSLGDQPFALTYSPGADLFHWCMRINAIIYEVGGEKNRLIQITIVLKSVDPALYDQ
jgi:hypothetical protein